MTTAELLDQKYAFLTGDVSPWEYGGKYIAPAIVIDGKRAFPIIEIGSFEEDYNTDTCKAFASVTVVCPGAAADELDNALKSWGMTFAQLDSEPMSTAQNERLIVEILSSYGASMPIEERLDPEMPMDFPDESVQALEHWAIGIVDGLSDPEEIEGHLGSTKNQIGATGRDFLEGNPLGWLAHMRDDR
jgi:hypothetical protein